MPLHAAGIAKSGRTIKGPKGTASQRAVNRRGKIKGRSGMANTKVKK